MATDTEDEAPPPEAEKKRRFSKKTVIIGAAAAVLLLGGSGGALLFMGGGEDEAGEEHGAAEGEGHGGEGETNLVEVPPMVINLRTADGQARFLKLRFLLVASSADSMALIEEKLPLIIDRYQPFLRELRPEDLAGSAAVYRLKEEMMLRAAEVVGANAVGDVLIQDMIQQ